LHRTKPLESRSQTHVLAGPAPRRALDAERRAWWWAWSPPRCGRAEARAQRVLQRHLRCPWPSMDTGAPCCRVCPTPPERARGMTATSNPQCTATPLPLNRARPGPEAGDPCFPILIVIQISIQIVCARWHTRPLQHPQQRGRFKLRRPRRRVKQHRALQRKSLPPPCRRPRPPRLPIQRTRNRPQRSRAPPQLPMRNQRRRQLQRRQTPRSRRQLLLRIALQIRSRCRGCRATCPAIVCAWKGTQDQLEQAGRVRPALQVSTRLQKAPRPARVVLQAKRHRPSQPQPTLLVDLAWLGHSRYPTRRQCANAAVRGRTCHQIWRRHACLAPSPRIHLLLGQLALSRASIALPVIPLQ
jgi:hypothetical protein